jgi:four helix bundle protein
MRTIGRYVKCRLDDLSKLNLWKINRSKSEPMNNENLKQRTKRFALNVISLTESLPKDQTCRILGGQLLRSRTSVGANYRAVCRAKSTADFISKFGTVEEEADESGYWLEPLVDAGKLSSKPAAALMQEASELTAIAVASINTARRSGGRHLDGAPIVNHGRK